MAATGSSRLNRDWNASWAATEVDWGDGRLEVSILILKYKSRTVKAAIGVDEGDGVK